MARDALLGGAGLFPELLTQKTAYANNCNAEYQDRIETVDPADPEAADAIQELHFLSTGASVPKSDLSFDAELEPNPWGLTDPQTDDASQSLVIDQVQDVSFITDHLTSLSSAEQARRVRAGWSSAVDSCYPTIETFIANTLKVVTPSGNMVGTTGSAVTPIKTDVMEFLADLAQKLGENNAPAMGRVCVVSPWLHGLMLKDSRYTASRFIPPFPGQAMRPGQVGWAHGMAIFSSLQVLNTGGVKHRILAWHPSIIQFYYHLYDVRRFTPDVGGGSYDGEGIRFWLAFGAKVTDATKIAMMTASPA